MGQDGHIRPKAGSVLWADMAAGDSESEANDGFEEKVGLEGKLAKLAMSEGKDNRQLSAQQFFVVAARRGCGFLSNLVKQFVPTASHRGVMRPGICSAPGKQAARTQHRHYSLV